MSKSIGETATKLDQAMLIQDQDSDWCCKVGDTGTHLDRAPMLGLWTPVGFGVGREASHLVGLGITGSPVRSAEVGLQLWLLGQQLTSCTAIGCCQSAQPCPHKMFSDARQLSALLISDYKPISELILMVLLPKKR